MQSINEFYSFSCNNNQLASSIAISLFEIPAKY